MAKAKKQTAREWLLENEYEDVVRKIDGLMEKWKREGKGTRRSWWAVLAGNKGGNPKVIDGVEFPVLRAAQRRMGVPVTKNAISKKKREKAPRAEEQERWKKHGADDD